MKKLLFFAATLFAIGGRIAAQSIPDGNFETNTTAIWMDPQYYITSNDQGSNNQNPSYGVPPNVTRTAGKYGNYGVQIATIKYDNDTIGGFIIDANPNGNGITGGIPYAQKPTGVRFWYKYTTTSVDTAVVLVMFRLAGNMIDSFLITIPSSASESNYTLYTYHHAVTTTPDSIIFGATSSKAMINNHGNYSTGIIPGSTFTIDSVTFTGVGANQPAELNGNFENWTPDTLIYPDGWYVSYPGETITTDAYAGNYALELETVNSPKNGPQVGQASTGYSICIPGHCYEAGGYPYTLKKDTLEFWYKYAPKPNDTATVQLSFLQLGNQINCCSGISIFTPAAVWTYTTVPFDYITAPDSVIVSISSSSHNHDTTSTQYLPYVGSILKVDNITFASQKHTLGINTISAIEGITVYPNPSTGQYTLTNLQAGMIIELYDYTGRKISSILASDATMQLNIANQPNGVYFLRALSSDGSLIGQQKIVKL